MPTATQIGIADWAQASSKPSYNVSEVAGAMSASDVSSAITTTVPSWARQTNKPEYTADEIGIAEWAQAENKPTYTASEVGAATQTDINTSITNFKTNYNISQPLNDLAFKSKIDKRDLSADATYKITATDVGAATTQQVNDAKNALITTYALGDLKALAYKDKADKSDITGLGTLAGKDKVGKNDLSTGSDKISASDVGATTLTEVQSQGYQTAANVDSKISAYDSTLGTLAKQDTVDASTQVDGLSHLALSGGKVGKSDLVTSGSEKIKASDVGVKIESNVLKVDNTAITATNVSARPNTWTPSASDVGAYSKGEIDSKNFQNATQVDTAITSKGYQTSTQVNNAITTTVPS